MDNNKKRKEETEPKKLPKDTDNLFDNEDNEEFTKGSESYKNKHK